VDAADRSEQHTLEPPSASAFRKMSLLRHSDFMLRTARASAFGAVVFLRNKLEAIKNQGAHIFCDGSVDSSSSMNSPH